MKKMKRTELNLPNFLRVTGLDVDDVFRALKTPAEIRWTYALSTCKGLEDSWHILCRARTELTKDPELLSKLANMHESRAQAVFFRSKDTKTLFKILKHSTVDSEVYTRSAEILIKHTRNHKNLTKLNQILSESKNEELFRSSRRKLSEACAKEISKKRLTLADLYRLRESAKNLTSINDAHKIINQRYDKQLNSFLSRPHTIDKLCSIQRYVELGRELSLVNSKITELVVRECKEGSSFWRGSRMLYRCRHMLENKDLLECMTHLHNKAKTFNELLSIFNRFTRSDWAKELRAKMLNKLIDIAKTQKQLMYMYNMELISDLSNNAHKPKIIKRLVTIHLKSN